ncbi:MAG: hypothetical protein QM723_38830 [Myxococcaceae bacterium]
MFEPVNANCCESDGNVNVLCCTRCGRCGDHLHDDCHDPHGHLKNPQLSNCPSTGAGCGNQGVLCCECGFCGMHLHSACVGS